MTNKNRLFTSTAVLVFLLTILAYVNHFDNGFHFDDGHTIEDNPYIKSIKNVPLFFIDAKTFSVAPQHQSYRPLLETTYAWDHWLAGGLNPLYFHITSFLLFILQCILLYFIFLKVLANDRYFALFAAAVYALHTAMAETVNYISARSDILSTCLVVFALYLYIYSKRSRKYFLYLIPVALSVLTKVTAAVFPLLLWAYLELFEEDEKPVWKRLWPSLLIVAVTAILSSFMLAKTFVPSMFSRWDYAVSQPYAILHYFISFIFPLTLNADSDWTIIKSVFDERVLMGVVFLLASFTLMIYAARKEWGKPLAFGFLWFFIACFPTSSGIVPLAEVVNDHRMYFPFIGLALAASWSLQTLFVKSRSKKVQWAIIVFMVAFLTAHAVGVHNRNKVWFNEESLWLDVTIKSPKNGRGLMNYGLTQMAKGNYKGAEYYFKAALNYTPYYTILYVNLGILNQAQGNMGVAEQYFLKALKYGPTFFEPYFYYSEFLHAVSRYGEQELNLKKALALSPSYMNVRYALMRLYSEQRRWKELEVVATETLNISPNDAMATDLLSYINKMRSLAEQLDVTLRYSKDKQAYVSLSDLYYQLGDYEKSVKVARDALKQYPKLDAVYKYLCLSYKAISYPNIPKECKHYL
jgi:tetratricopeptide (TPR) repeat protein